MVSLTQMQLGQVTLTDAKGNVLVDFEPVKQYQAIILSVPEIVVGETYTLTAGNYTQEITMTSLQFGSGASSGKR